MEQMYVVMNQILLLFGLGMATVCIAGMWQSRPEKHHNEKEPPSTPKPNFTPPKGQP